MVRGWPDARHRPWSNSRRLRTAKTESWCQRKSSKPFFRAGSQHHVGENLVPEYPAAAGGIIRQGRSLSAIVARAFALSLADGAFLQVIQQPTGDFPPLLRWQLPQRRLDFQKIVHYGQTYQNRSVFARGILQSPKPSERRGLGMSQITIPSQFGLTLPLLANSSPPVSFTLAGE